MSLDSTERQKLLKLIKKEAPTAYRVIFGRKYLLPPSRQGDYFNLEFDTFLAFDRCALYASGAENAHDEVWRICLGNTLAALNYGRPTLFLERELGEALMRTALLPGLATSDIRWRWPAFRIVLPLGLITIEREDGPRSLTHVDLSQIDPGCDIFCPPVIAREIDLFVWRHRETLRELPRRPEALRLSTSHFGYREHGMIVSTATDRPEHGQAINGLPSVQTLYASVKPFGETIDIGNYQAVEGDLQTPFPQDASDRDLLSRLEHLVLNVLLFLSSNPQLYQPNWVDVVRKARQSDIKPELVRARFVGDMQFRPLILKQHQPSTPTGRHLAAHWRSGHWRRVAFGKGKADERIQWIKPYQTHPYQETSKQ